MSLVEDVIRLYSILRRMEELEKEREELDRKHGPKRAPSGSKSNQETVAEENWMTKTRF